MPLYFNYLSLENEEIEYAVDFYLRPSLDKYWLVALPQDVHDLPAGDPSTHINSFWPLSRDQINQHIALLFPDNFIIQRPLTCEEVKLLFEFDPTNTIPNQFDGIHRFRESNIDHLTVLLSSGDILAKQHAAWALAQLDVNHHSIDATQRTHAIGQLIPLLTTSTHMLTIRSSALALFNFARDTQNHQVIREAHGITPLIPLLASTDILTMRHATTTLAYLAKNVLNHPIIHEAKGITPLISRLTSTDALTTQFATAALANLTQNEHGRKAIREAEGITPLISRLTSTDALTVQYVTLALTYLTSDQQNHRVINEAQGIRRLIPLLTSTNALTVQYATAALMGLSRDERNRKIIREAQGITPLIQRLASTDTLTVRYAASALYNMTGNEQNGTILRNKHELIPYIALLTCDDPPTKTHICSLFLLLNTLTISLENDDYILQNVEFNKFIPILIEKAIHRYQVCKDASGWFGPDKKLHGAIQLITALITARNHLLACSSPRTDDENQAFKDACLDAIKQAKPSFMESTSKPMGFLTSKRAPSFLQLILEMKQTVDSLVTISAPPNMWHLG